MTEPFDKASAGQPITSLRWNNMQVAIRDEIEALKATKLNLAGGVMTGTLEVSRAAAQGVPDDLLRVRSDAGNVGLRVETGAAASDVAALRFYHGPALTGQISVSAGRLSVSETLHVQGGRLGVGVPAPQQTLHVAGRMALEQGVIQRGGPPIGDTSDLGLYSQVDGNAVRIVTRNAPVRFFSDAGIGNLANLDVLPTGDLKVRRNSLAAALGVGTDTPQDLVHVLAPAGNLGLRLQNGAGPADFNTIRFIHGNTERAFVATHGATGRFTVSNTLNVWPGARVGVGPGSEGAPPVATLEVRGDLQVVGPNTRNGLLINQAHTGFSNGTRDRAEISVDPNFKTLMLVGSVAAAQDEPALAWPAQGRRVSVWDRLEVNGYTLTQYLGVGLPPVVRPAQALHVSGNIYLESGIIQRGGGTLGGTADLGLYSQVPNNWIRIVTTGAPVTFRSDGGIGGVSNLDVNPNGDIVVRRNVTASRIGAGVADPQDLLHVKSGGGAAGLRIDAAGAAPTDQALIRFLNADVVTGHLAAVAGGRLTISNTLSVHLNQNRVGIGTGADVPGDTLHVRTAAGTGLRLEAGGGASDTAALRFVHAAADRGALTSGGPPGIGLSLSAAAPGQTLRYLTNGGSHIFYGDSGGVAPNFTLDKEGNAAVRKALRVEELADLGGVHVRARTFKVLGDINLYYPVFFADLGWEDGPCTIEITRANVHRDVSWWGSLQASFTYHSTNWGHGAEFIAVQLTQYNQDGRKRFVARYGRVLRNSELVVWLRGNTTYSWRSNHRAELVANNSAATTRAEETFGVLNAVDLELDQDRVRVAPDVSRTVFRGAIVPSSGNSEQAGILFPPPDMGPASGANDFAFIRQVVAGDSTSLRIGVENDPDDSLRLWQAGNDRLILQNGQVTVSGVPYAGPQARMFNAEGEMKSFGGGAGYRMSDRAEPGNEARDWVVFPNAKSLNFWNGTNGALTVLDSDGCLFSRQANFEFGVIQRGGAKITGTQDLGLYSQYSGHWMRFVTNAAPIRFFSDSGTGSTINVSFEANGDASFRGRLVAPKLQLGSKWLLSGDGDVEANDHWLRLKSYNGATNPGYQAGYYGGLAAWFLWSYNGVNQGSDRALKRDIVPLRASLDRICRLQGVRFRWNDARDDREHIGLVAQEVQEHFPEVVEPGPDRYLGVHYAGLVAPLIEAVKEQQLQIEALRREVAQLRERTP